MPAKFGQEQTKAPDLDLLQASLKNQIWWNTIKQREWNGGKHAACCQLNESSVMSTDHTVDDSWSTTHVLIHAHQCARAHTHTHMHARKFAGGNQEITWGLKALGAWQFQVELETWNRLGHLSLHTTGPSAEDNPSFISEFPPPPDPNTPIKPHFLFLLLQTRRCRRTQRWASGSCASSSESPSGGRRPRSTGSSCPTQT